MKYIALGLLSFSFFYLFDFNKLKNGKKWLNLSFGLGVAGLSLATLGIIVSQYDASHGNMVRLITGLTLGVIFLALLVYSLFFALPFDKTYAQAHTGKSRVIDTGLYALCRHPGVHAFLFFYAALYLAFGINTLLYAGILWWLSDILHVYIQDKYLFVRTLDKYNEYKLYTPFLIPNRKSIRRCAVTLKFRWRKGDSI